MSTATFAEPAVDATIPAPPEPMETDDALYEIVRGERVDIPPMSVRAVMIATRLSSAINAFVMHANDALSAGTYYFRVRTSGDQSTSTPGPWSDDRIAFTVP